MAFLFCSLLSLRPASAQEVMFNHTYSAAAFSNPALVAFRESPMVGLHHNDNNGVLTNSLISASVPLKELGLQAGYLRDDFSVLIQDFLVLGANRVFVLNDIQLAFALNFEGARNGFDDEWSSIYPHLAVTKYRLAYAIGGAARYKGFTLFAGTRQRTILSSEFSGNNPITSAGLGYSLQKEHWRLQIIASHERVPSNWISNGFFGLRYRFIEMGFGGKYFKGGNAISPAYHAAWVNKRFKLVYTYLDRSTAYPRVIPGYNLQEHEVSLLVSLHKKGNRAQFEIF